MGRRSAATAPAAPRDQPQQLPPSPPTSRSQDGGAFTWASVCHMLCTAMLCLRLAKRRYQTTAVHCKLESMTQHSWSLHGRCFGQAECAAAPPESRAARRRPGRLRAAAEASCAVDPAETAADAPPRRLETHVWHAKRFKMHVRCTLRMLRHCGQHLRN